MVSHRRIPPLLTATSSRAPPLPGEAGEADARAIARFLEKPDAPRAAGLIAEGALWNGGYFLFRADVMLDELATYAPAVLAAARETFESATNDLDFVRLGEEAFGREPQISIDFAVMERTARAGVLPVSFPWSDIGTWGALWEVLPRDGDGNALRGRVTVRDTRNSLMHSSWMAALSDRPVGEDLRQEILRSPTHVLYVLRRGEAGLIVGAVLHGKPSEALPAFTPTARSATVPPVVPERGVTTR